ncbi:MAG: hypothetical protein R2880_20105 [Deinococcales bacterium]
MGEQGPAGPQGPASVSTGSSGATATTTGTTGVGSGSSTNLSGTTNSNTTTMPQLDAGLNTTNAKKRNPLYFGVGLAPELSPTGRLNPVRFNVGGDNIFLGLGGRVNIDYNRQVPFSNASTLAIAARATYQMDLGWLYPYVGLGGGYQLVLRNLCNSSNQCQANSGPFVGALLGVEIPLFHPVSLFAEVTADYYFNQPPSGFGGYSYNRLYPTFGFGVNFRP